MGLIIKNGVIYNGAESEPVVYSLDEREIGVWIDGKPLYQKTFVTSNLSSGKTTIAHNLTNIDQIWLDNSATHFISGDNNATTPYYSGGYGDGGAYVDGYVNIVQLNKTNITIKLASSSSIVNGKGYIVISYTKTTDTPGSGTWTPSGVKSEHYSTNEHVVGTWIDGSTIYERTLYKDLSGQAEHWYVYLDTLIDDINDYTIINFEGQLQFKEGSYIYSHIIPNYIGGSSYYYINRTNGRWYLYFHSGNATCDWGYMAATIRYVKKILGQPSS